MRDYYVRFLKRILQIKGKDYIDSLLNLGTITQDEYDEVLKMNTP
ncbi:hypothetical protein [Abyssisolibacter fermentans]|nr:hypothetical protein [Abyssisolibacter fermentans]